MSIDTSGSGGGVTGTLICSILTALQTEHVMQIIQLVCTILCALATMAYTLWRWHRKAMADGKLTTKEINEGIKIVEDTAKDLQEQIDKHVGKGDDTSEHKQ